MSNGRGRVTPGEAVGFRAIDRSPQARTIGALLFAAAIILYAPGLGWGLPVASGAERIHPWGTDEIAPLGFGELYAAILHRTDRIDPRYPLLPFILQAMFAAPYLAFLGITGGLAGAAPVYPYGLSDPVRSLQVLTVIGRLPSLLCGAGLVVMAWKTARALWGDRAGLLAGAIVMLLPPGVYYSRTSNVDVIAMFWMALGLYELIRAIERGLTPARARRLGLWAALATATKDHAYAVFLAAGLVLLASRWLTPRSGRRDRFGRSVAWGIATASLAYVVASGLVFSPDRYVRHIEFIATGSPVSPLRMGYGSAAGTLQSWIDLGADVVAFVAGSLGLPVLLLAVAGAALAGRGRVWAVVLPCLAILPGVILPVRFVEYRFVWPLAYGLVFLAVACATRALDDRRPSLGGRAAVAVAVGWLLLVAADVTHQMLDDPRTEASAWLAAHGRPGERVAYIDLPYKLPRLPPDLDIVALAEGVGAHEMARREVRDSRPEFIAVVPVLQREVAHEHLLPDDVYRGLRDGSLGYRVVLAVRTEPLVSYAPVPAVNPPVLLFARADVAAREGAGDGSDVRVPDGWPRPR